MLLVRLVVPEVLAIRDREDLLEGLVIKDLQDRQVAKVLLETLEKQVPQDREDILDHLEHKGLLGHLDRLE